MRVNDRLRERLEGRLTDGVDGDLDLGAQDLVPLEDAEDFLAVVGHGAEWVFEGGVAGEVFLQCFLLSCSSACAEAEDHALDFRERVVHGADCVWFKGRRIEGLQWYDLQLQKSSVEGLLKEDSTSA